MTNIIKCTLKKSISLTLMFLKWGSIIGIILAAIAGIAYLIWSIRDIIGSGWNTYASWTSSLLAGVPWYVWIIIAIPSTIMVYSYIWCWDRQNHHKIGQIINEHMELIIFAIFGLILGIILDFIIVFPSGILDMDIGNYIVLVGFLPLAGLLAGILAGIILRNGDC